MANRSHITPPEHNRSESIATAFAVTFMLALAFAGLMKPDAVTGRAAPLALEAVR